MVFINKLITGDKPEKIIVYLLIPLFFLLIVFPAAFQSNQVFISEYHDTINYFMSDLIWLENPLALWNNNWIAGFPVVSNGGSSLFYPFSFPLLFVSQDVFISNLIIVLNLYIAYLAFFKLGSLVVKNSDLLMLSSLGYMFCGALISRVYIGHIAFVCAMAMMPFIYYFFLKITLKSEVTIANIVFFAVFQTLLAFSSFPYFTVYCNAILGIFFLYYLFTRKITKPKFIALFSSFILFGLLSSIKLIPILSLIPYIQRVDIINPLIDGGSLENNLASFIAGTPIEQVFGFHESAALIGIILVLFAIIALVWGNKDIVIPSFFAIVFSFIWADGGNTLLSFIHLLPYLDSLRNAGRIFSALSPILLLLSVYGVYIVYQKTKNQESFEITGSQKKNLAFGAALLIIIKVLELPFQGPVSPEAFVSLVLVFGFIGLIYFNKTNLLNLKLFFSASILIDLFLISRTFSLLNETVLIKGCIISCILLGVLLIFNRGLLNKKIIKDHFFGIILVLAILLLIIGNISILTTSDPHLNESPALKIIEKIKEYPSNTPQIWDYEYGWAFQHMDFTYWMMKNHIHPMRAHYAYYLKTMPPISLKVGNTDYYTADYIIDTAYLENGNQNLPEVSFKVNNISVFKPEHVFPNAFVVRKDQLVSAKFEKFTPDEVILSGQFLQGDVAVLKSAFYPGWKINNHDTSNVGNMIGAQLSSDTSSVTFRFDPLDVKIGAILSGIGIFVVIVFIIKRREIEKYLNEPGKKVIQDRVSKKKKR
jgi:hypothetical protein